VHWDTPPWARTASADAVGIRLADAGGVLPRAEDADYASALCTLAAEHGVTSLIPTVAEELVALHDCSGVLSAAGIAYWLPSPRAVVSCTDKWLFHQAATAAGTAVPETALGTTEGVTGPWVIKPRHGRGSRDIYFSDDADEVAELVSLVPDPLVQHRLSGSEFTVDALVDERGRLAAAVPRWRLETKAGISTLGETFVDDAVTQGVGALLGALGHTGPANVQGFAADAPAGGGRQVVFTEVNPRFSGGCRCQLLRARTWSASICEACSASASRPSDSASCRACGCTATSPRSSRPCLTRTFSAPRRGGRGSRAGAEAGAAWSGTRPLPGRPGARAGPAWHQPRGSRRGSPR